MEGRIISAAKLKVRKVESDEEASDFDCYDKSDGKLVDVDIDKEVTEGDPTVALIQKRSAQ